MKTALNMTAGIAIGFMLLIALCGYIRGCHEKPEYGEPVTYKEWRER